MIEIRHSTALSYTREYYTDGQLLYQMENHEEWFQQMKFLTVLAMSTLNLTMQAIKEHTNAYMSGTMVFLKRKLHGYWDNVRHVLSTAATNQKAHLNRISPIIFFNELNVTLMTCVHRPIDNSSGSYILFITLAKLQDCLPYLADLQLSLHSQWHCFSDYLNLQNTFSVILGKSSMVYWRV